MIHTERVFLFPSDISDAASGVFHYDDGEEDGIPFVRMQLSNGVNQFLMIDFQDAEELEEFRQSLSSFFLNAEAALDSTSESEEEV
jgi:hypothetical protein